MEELQEVEDYTEFILVCNLESVYEYHDWDQLHHCIGENFYKNNVLAKLAVL